ncbi:histidine phosphatase family protein [Rhodobacterales bacterium HKCCE2091]|nr:histidine phosphatase family protein [Rhodobacterales bacterium HKCCE2091]
MTLRLILLRHAKSDWNDAGLDDHDRPLNERGRDAAPRIGAWLARDGHEPDAAMVSTARRTVETWALVSAAFADPPEPVFSRGLYLASPGQILAQVRGAEGRALLVIGHNPGIGSLARSLAATPPDHPKFARYPTGAATVLEFAGEDWSAIGPGHGRTIAFTVPRDLTG